MHDYMHADLDTSADDEDITAQSSATTSQTTHMVRGTWLSTSGGFPTYGLPQPLLTYLRAALGCEVDEPAAEADVRVL
jgi:protein-histidine N-methyltransferase